LPEGALTSLPYVSASEMTYIVSGGALNSTHSLTLPYVMRIATLQVKHSHWRHKVVFKLVFNTNG